MAGATESGGNETGNETGGPGEETGDKTAGDERDRGDRWGNVYGRSGEFNSLQVFFLHFFFISNTYLVTGIRAREGP